MWVISCGMQRSGSTLQYQIAAELVGRSPGGCMVGPMRSPEFAPMQNDHAGTGALALVKFHPYSPEAAALISSGRAKGIYSYRDLRDVVVSLMHLWKQPFHEAVTREFVRDLVMTDRLWRSCSGMLVTRYDDLRSDLSLEIRRIAEHIGVPCDEQLVSELAGKLEFEKQKKRVEEFNFEKDAVVQGGFVYDPKSLLNPGHIRSGESGQWRKSLSRYQVALVEAWSGDWLPGNGFQHSQNALVRSGAAAWHACTAFLRLLPGRLMRLLANPTMLRKLWSRSDAQGNDKQPMP